MVSIKYCVNSNLPSNKKRKEENAIIIDNDILVIIRKLYLDILKFIYSYLKNRKKKFKLKNYSILLF